MLPAFVPSYVAFEFTYVAAYAIAILGLIILTGLGGQISLGGGAFVAVGGYAVAILAQRLDLPFWLTIPLAAILSGLAGLLIGPIALRLEGVYLALATFALALAVPSILKRFRGFTGGVGGLVLQPVAAPKFGGATMTSEQWLYYIAWALVGVLFLATSVVLRGRVGRALRALRDNEIAAISFGVDPFFYKTLAFGWSAAYAGVAGAIIALATAFVSPDTYGLTLSLALLIGAVLGGLETMWGALAGGIIVEFLPLWAQKVSAAAPSVVYGIALILVMIFMPAGIAGTLQRAVRGTRPGTHGRDYTTYPFR